MRALDTYVGRKITSFDNSTKHWFIELEGGIRVINRDADLPSPTIPNIVGMRFVTLSLDVKSTQMVLFDELGSEFRISFNPLEYEIYDTESGSAWYPQAGGYGAFKPREASTITPEIPQKEAERKNTKLAQKKSSTKKTQRTRKTK